MRTNILKLFATCILLLLASYAFAKRRPNIVLIMADDLGGRDLPTYGNKFNEAPNIEKLANQGMVHKRLSNILTEMGVDFIKESKEEPFFLFLSHYDVHVQLDADKDLIDKYLNKKKHPDYSCNAVYAAMIEHVDNSVGVIMETIDEMGLTDNTIFIFYSDNGGVDNRYDNIPLLGGESTNVYPDEHPLRYIATSNAPLRGGKGTLYEGGIRVPLIVRWPGIIAPSSKTEAIVSSVDFYPTFLDLAKGKNPKKQVLDGFSMVPIWKDNIFDTEREVFTHYPVYHHDQPMSAVRKGDWKLVQNLVTNSFELYNLKYDIHEMTDLKFSYPVKLEAMKEVLKKWQKDTKAKMPLPNPNFDPIKRNEWGRENGATLLEVSVPPKCTANIFFPNEKGRDIKEATGFAKQIDKKDGYTLFEVPSGTYQFTN